MRLKVVLGADCQAFFTISLNSNLFVDKWIQELRWCLTNCEFNQDEAFAKFLSLDESSKILTEACYTINCYLKNFIEVRENILDQDQDYFNYLHLKFEELSGQFEKPTRLFTIANQDLKSAIRKLNFFVHRVEKKKKIPHSLYISFNKDQYRRQPLMDEDYQNFEFKSFTGWMGW